MSSGSYQNTPNPHIGSVGGPVLTNGHCESVPQLDTPNPSPANFGTAATSNNQYSISPQAIAEKLHSLAVNNSPSDSPSRSPQRLSESHDNTTPNHEEITPNHEKTTTASHQRVIVMTDEFGIKYEKYQSEHQMADIMKLISDLSEPYSIYTYRYFIHNWPNLCFLAHDESDGYIGAIVCKLDQHKRTSRSRGYIAMLAVHGDHRRKRIGSKLVGLAIDVMMSEKCDEIVLETECTNLAALNLYERLGFIRDKRLYKYYLNGVDAFRLKLWVT